MPTQPIALTDIDPNSEYAMMVMPSIREQAARIIQSKYRATHGKTSADKIQRHNSLIAITEPSSPELAIEIATIIAQNNYHQLPFDAPEFNRSLLQAFRTQGINKNQLLTANLLFQALSCFNGGTMPTQPANYLKRYALMSGPYDFKKIGYYSKYIGSKIEESAKRQPYHYYTIALQPYQIGALLYFGIDNNKFEMLPYFSKIIDLYVSSLIDTHKEKATWQHGFKHSTEKAAFIKQLIKKYEPKVKTLIYVNQHPEANTQYPEAYQEAQSLAFLALILAGVSPQMPCVIPTDNSGKNFSFVIPSMDTMTLLLHSFFGNEYQDFFPIVGSVPTRLIRAMDDVPNHTNSLTQQLLLSLYPELARLKHPSRAIEITHPDTIRTANPHEFFCHDFLLTWHDLFHVWHASENMLDFYRYLRTMHGDKGSYALKSGSDLMSEAIWHFTDIDINFGMVTKLTKSDKSLSAKKAKQQLQTTVMKDFIFHLVNMHTTTKDKYYEIFDLITFEFFTNWAQWRKRLGYSEPELFLSDLQDSMTSLNLAPEDRTALNYFFQRAELNKQILSRYPQADVMQMILIGFAMTLLETEQQAFMHLIHVLDLHDILYWSKNSGIFFQKSIRPLLEAHQKNHLVDNSPQDIFRILTRVFQQQHLNESFSEAMIHAGMIRNLTRISEPKAKLSFIDQQFSKLKANALSLLNGLSDRTAEFILIDNLYTTFLTKISPHLTQTSKKSSVSIQTNVISSLQKSYHQYLVELLKKIHPNTDLIHVVRNTVSTPTHFSNASQPRVRFFGSKHTGIKKELLKLLSSIEATSTQETGLAKHGK
jgi:uncharacterized protein YbcV (DUF1398 family)